MKAATKQLIRELLLSLRRIALAVIAVIAIIVLIFVAFFTILNARKSPEPSYPPPVVPPVATTHPLNKIRHIGPLRYEVVSYEWTDQIPHGYQYFQADHRFLVIHVRAENLGGKPLLVPSPVLIDDRDREYARIYLNKWPNNFGVLESEHTPRLLNPDDELEGAVIFDVKENKNYRLRMYDDGIEPARKDVLIRPLMKP